MSAKAVAFNKRQIDANALTMEDITDLVAFWQKHHGLTVDGMAGTTQTIPSIRRERSPTTSSPIMSPGVRDRLMSVRPLQVGIRSNLFIEHELVTSVLSHDTWKGGIMLGVEGIVAHYSATDHGTAVAMAKRRTKPHGSDPSHPKSKSSWHISIEGDGSIVQMIPFTQVANHAGGDGSIQIPGIGWANNHTIGIELIGHGTSFSDAQVASAALVWRSLTSFYEISREHAMISHQSINPTHRSDPGPVWMNQYAELVLDYAFRP